MIILASTSPRRKELLSKIVQNFKTIEPQIDEENFRYFHNDEISRNLAKLKAYSVFNEYQNDCVIASDTVVILNSTLLGKPRDQHDAIRMLNILNNKRHVVITSYCILYKEFEITKSIKSVVFFNDNSPKLLGSYIESGKWLGKAGAYGIQDEDFDLVNHVDGSIYNVMGLPIEEIKKDLTRLGLIK